MYETNGVSPKELCQANGEIFFRDADILRFNRVFEAVVEEEYHLLITSQFDGVTDHYGKMILNRLKMRSGLAVETYMPASTEALVARFNEMINSMSVEEARGELPTSSPGRIIIVNDPKAIESDGWILLSRMITDFPSLNMRLVFLLDRMSQTIEKALDRFGSRLIRWDVEPPSSDEQRILRKEGMANGLEFQVERALSRISETLSQQLEPSFEVAEGTQNVDLDQPSLDGTRAGQREAADMRTLFNDEPEIPKKRGSFLGFCFTLLVLTLIGISVAGFVSPLIGNNLDRLLNFIGFEDSVFSRPERTQSVVDAAYDRAKDMFDKTFAESQNPASQIVLNEDLKSTSDATTLSDLEKSEELSDQAYSQPIGSVPAASSPTTSRQTLSNAIAAQETSLVSNQQDAEALESSAIDPTLITNAGPEASNLNSAYRKNLEIVREAKPEFQFVQHLVLKSALKTKDWKNAQTTLTKAMIVPITVNGQPNFAVVSGPFEVSEETRAYIQGIDGSADYWVRSAGSLQEILRD